MSSSLKESIFSRLKGFSGKIRRFYITHFRKGYLKTQLIKRRGVCKQCGKCCKLGVECIFLSYRNGVAFCRIYRYRPKQCRIFPIDARDIEESGCIGFYFRSPEDSD